MIRKVLGASAAVPTAGSAVAAARAAVRAGTGHRSGYEPVLNRADFVTKITHLFVRPAGRGDADPRGQADDGRTRRNPFPGETFSLKWPARSGEDRWPRPGNRGGE